MILISIKCIYKLDEPRQTLPNFSFLWVLREYEEGAIVTTQVVVTSHSVTNGHDKSSRMFLIVA